MSTFIVLIFTICICAMIVMSGKCKMEDDELLGKNECSALKGVAILLVFVHHYGQLYSDTYSAHSFLGYIGVTIFLLITGYVSEKQFLLKGKRYVSFSFIKKKVMRLYIPYVLITLIYAILGRHDVSNTISELIHIEADWFLTAVTIFYLLFMMANLIASKSNQGYGIGILTGVIIVYVIFQAMIGNSVVWYNTAFAFLVGVYIAYIEWKKSGRKALIRRREIKFCVTLLSVVLTVLFVVLSIMRIGYSVTSTLASTCLSLMIIFLSEHMKITNKCLALIGTLSWEFYLCQSKNLMIVKDYLGGNVLVGFGAALAISIIVAVIVNKGLEFIKKTIKA